jgi:eukaryotic-like serine/threonine-protein kinase
MKSPSAGEVPSAPDDPLPHILEPLMDLSTLDTLVEEPVTGTPRRATVIRPRAAIATLPPPQPAPNVSKAVKATTARRQFTLSSAIIGLLLLLVIGEGIAIGMLIRRPIAAPIPDSGAFVMETVPAGARVIIDDADRGETPLKLALPPGSHKVVVTLGSQTREIPVDIAAGRSYERHLEFAAPPPSVANGGVDIRTRPSGASVVIAGQARGKTPVTVRDLPPGTHDVLLQLNGQQLRETVTVQTGTTVQLSAAFSAPSASRGSGWIAIASPVELTIVEEGQVLGTTRSPRIMVPAGRHTLELVNERLGFRATRVIDVEDGKTAALTPELPKGTVSVNALPWAEVWMQDRKVGDTPLANLSLPIGSHQLVFRHPSLGERVQDVIITAGATARISVDMRR